MIPLYISPCVATNVKMPDNVGPVHGIHITPNAHPSINPDSLPLDLTLIFEKKCNFWKGFLSNKIKNPNNIIIIGIIVYFPYKSASY